MAAGSVTSPPVIARGGVGKTVKDIKVALRREISSSATLMLAVPMSSPISFLDLKNMIFLPRRSKTLSLLKLNRTVKTLSIDRGRVW